MNKLAIPILCLRRHDYLRELIRTLEQNPKLQDVDFYLFQDGARNPLSGKIYATQGDIDACVQLFESSRLPNKIVIQQEDNIGTVEGLFLALNELFGRGYEYVTTLSCDNRVGKYFVKSLLVLYDQFKDDRKAGILRTGPIEPPGLRDHVHTLEEARALEDKVAYGCVTQQNLGLWRECWNDVLPTVSRYHDMIKGCDYTELMGVKYFKHNSPRRDFLLEVASNLEGAFGTIHEDTTIDLSAKAANYKSLHTLTPRTVNTGAKSTLGTWTEDDWRRFGLNRITLWDIGDVDHYTIVPSAEITKPVRNVPDQPLPLRPLPSPPKRMMVYKGPETAPFPIRGDKSRKMYYRIYPNKPIEVSPEDMEFFLKNGFVEI